MKQLQIREYDLPDSYLFKKPHKKNAVKVWVPKILCAVLGRSNNSKDSLHLKNIIEDDIPVYKRPTGGESVILSTNTIVISIALIQSNFKGGKTYFDIINNKLKMLLTDYGIGNIEFRGISDLAIGDVKIMGSALYQNKDIVFYHAVLNIAESTILMERYLKLPIREPDYRKNRQHGQFVTSLKNERYNIKIPDLIKYLQTHLQNIQF